MKRILEDMRNNEDLLHKEKTCDTSKRVEFYVTLKTQRPSGKRYV